MIDVGRDAIAHIVPIDYAAIGPDVVGEIIRVDQVVDESFEYWRERRHESALPRTGPVEIEETAVHYRFALIATRSFAGGTEVRRLLQFATAAPLALSLDEFDQFIFEFFANDLLVHDETVQHVNLAVHQREFFPRYC
jgi:hypothetical protein